MNYTKYLNQFNNSQYRLIFLRNFLITDMITNFESGVFSDQAVHSFQLKLLRTEIGRAKEDSGRTAEDLGKVRDIVRRIIDKRLWLSVINYVLRQARINALATRLSYSKKIEKLADRQDRSLGKLHRKAVNVLDDLKMPG